VNDNTARLILTAAQLEATRIRLQQRAESERRGKQAYEDTGKPEGLRKQFPGLKMRKQLPKY